MRNTWTNYQNSFGEFAKDSFGAGPQFIVDATHSLPTGQPIKWGYCLTNVTGFDYDSDMLVTGSGEFPVNMVVGVELPAGLLNITVTDGSILCYLA
jgi:hypothetical protein